MVFLRYKLRQILTHKYIFYEIGNILNLIYKTGSYWPPAKSNYLSYFYPFLILFFFLIILLLKFLLYLIQKSYFYWNLYFTWSKILLLLKLYFTKTIFFNFYWIYTYWYSKTSTGTSLGFARQSFRPIVNQGKRNHSLNLW